MATETPLERMLRDAWHEPGLRPAFYKRLLKSDVLVPVQPRSGQVVGGKIDAGETLDVITFMRNDQVAVIPFYSSPEHLFKASPAGEKCVVTRVRELFQMRPDMHFHLNPFSVYGREFSPLDTRSLLATGGIAVTERIWIPNAQEANLREPDRPPRAVLDALRVLFARNLEIRAAYIAQRVEPEPDGEELLVVVDLVEGGSQARALREAGTVIIEMVEPGTPRFGFAVLPRDDSPIARYFKQVTPFYTIGLAGSIAAALRR
jgi:hypothetical protein